MSDGTTDQPTYGPYETDRQAAGDCRDTYICSYGRPGGLARANRERLTAACAAARVELGAFDKQIVDWLAGWEPETVQVIIGIISRANRSDPRDPAVHAAERDAERLREVTEAAQDLLLAAADGLLFAGPATLNLADAVKQATGWTVPKEPEHRP